MQTAQRIIRGYRRRRLIVCIGLAVLVLLLTLSARYVSERKVNEQHLPVSYTHLTLPTIYSV